jgi:hypothetical protein
MVRSTYYCFPISKHTWPTAVGTVGRAISAITLTLFQKVVVVVVGGGGQIITYLSTTLLKVS